MHKFKKDPATLSGNHSYIMLFDGDVEHVRENQPCMGELRKYENTHPGECTQSHNPKPGDLHWPFPSGIPTGLYFNLNTYASPDEYKNKLIELFFDQESPWISGFKNCEFNRRADGAIIGVYIPHGDFDPTVFVNLSKHVKGTLSPNKINEVFMLLDGGLNIREALMLATVNPFPISQGVYTPYYYTNSKCTSIRRFLDANARDLTGGLWSERVDYNRTDMGEVFSNPDNKKPWVTAFNEKGIQQFKGGSNVLDLKKDAKRLKEVIQEIYNEEPVPVDTKYSWKTTSGKTDPKELSRG